MPISVTCRCGRELKVSDWTGGFRVRCPRCWRVSVVPRNKPAPPPAPPAPKAKPRPAAEPAPQPAQPPADDYDRPRRRSAPPPPPREKPKNTLTVVLGFGGGLVAVGLAVAVALLITAVAKRDQAATTETATPTRPDPLLLPPPPDWQPQPQPPDPPPEPGPPPEGWSAFQGEGFRVHVPTGSDFTHDPRPSDVPFFGEREKVWMSHKTATPGQPVYGVSVVKLTRTDQDEYKRNPDPAWAKVVRIAGGLPADKYTYQKDVEVTVRGADARQYTFPIAGTLHGLVRFAVLPDAGQIYAWSVITRDPVGGDEPMVKPFLDGFAIDRPAAAPPPAVPATPSPPTDGDTWKEVAGDGFTIKVPAAEGLFATKGGLFANRGICQSTRRWTSVDPTDRTRHRLTLGVSVSDLDPAFLRRLEAKPADAWDEVFREMRLVNESDRTATPTMAEATLGGRAGRQMAFRFEGVLTTYRCVEHKGKLYVVSLDRFTGDSDEPVKKCFDSFKITP